MQNGEFDSICNDLASFIRHHGDIAKASQISGLQNNTFNENHSKILNDRREIASVFSSLSDF